MNEQEAIRQLMAAMQSRNLVFAAGKQPTADGGWHRCSVLNKPGRNTDGSYLLDMMGPAPWGLYKNWTDGQGCDYWRGDRNRALTDAELEELERRAEQARIKSEEEAAKLASAAAEFAKSTWERAQQAPPSHPYLQKKGIKPNGTRVSEQGYLLVPMHDENGELVNLQFIDGSNKWFLTGGLTKGCCYPLPCAELTPERVVVCEGFATGASITEATPYEVGVAFSAYNLPAIAMNVRKFLSNRDDVWWHQAQSHAPHGLVHDRRPDSSMPVVFADPKIVIAADDDWKTKGNPGLMKGLEAARVANALIALPSFGDDRGEAETDFNDVAAAYGGDNPDYVKQLIDDAKPPQTLLERLLLDDPHSAHGEAMIEELAAWKRKDAVFYEKLLAELKKNGVRVRELDGAVKNTIKRAAAKAAAARAARGRQSGEEVDPEALARSAAPLIASQSVLDLFTKEHSKLYVGEEKNAKLLYLICVSRRFELKLTMHGAVKGQSSIGKSELLDAVTAFMPPESVFRFTSLSEKALLYLPDDGNLTHKILVMAEAPKDEEQQQFQLMMLRELMSRGVLEYPVVEKTEHGFETVTKRVEGPVAFLVSTTKVEVDQENETRMLSLELDDSPAQTKRVMMHLAKVEGLNLRAKIDFAPWHDFQRWLGTGERRVHIFYATDLINLIPAKAVRLRRDVGQLLRAIKAHALLHRQHRKRGEVTGAIMATFADYKAVRELMVDTMSEGAEIKARTNLPETVAAVQSAQRASRRDGATVNEIAPVLEIDRSATKRRLDHAIKAGQVALVDARKGRAFLYATTGATLANDATLLPTMEAVRQAFEQRRERERWRAQTFSRQTPLESRAQLHSSRLRH
jgi:phage/plasmid primase-like uncharacterized protein